MKEHPSREPQAAIDGMFPDRWSPRAFAPEPLSDYEVEALFEAARWAPSCYNEQPWTFVFARTAEDRERFAAPLSKKNRLWARRAPLMVYLLSRRRFAQDGRHNRHAAFDAGAAWMSLALQARKLGLYTHAMAGFDTEEALKVIGACEAAEEILVAIVIGRRGDPNLLPAHLKEREFPNDRNPLESMVHEGKIR